MLTSTKLIAVDQLGSEIQVSATLKKNFTRGSVRVRVRTPCGGLVRVRIPRRWSVSSFALTAGGLS